MPIRTLTAGTLLAAVAMTAATAAQAAPPPVTIGIVAPLSGPDAQFGQNMRNGLAMAVAEINAAGGIKSLGGAPVDLVYADTPAAGAAGPAVQRLVNQDHVVGIIGAFVSNISLAASEQTERLGVPMITHSFADKITERGYHDIFQMTPKASAFGTAGLDQALALAKRAGEPVTKIAILWEDTSYGTSQAKGIRAEAAARGITVAVDEGYPQGITDVSPLIDKLRGSGAQLVFPVSYFNDAVQIIRGMRQQGLSTPVVGGAAGYIIPAFGKALGPLADGVLSVAPANYDNDPAIATAYEKRYGIWPSHEALMYPAALDDMVHAVEVAKSRDPAAIRNAIAATRFCGGWAAALPQGCLAYESHGLATTSAVIMVQWQKGGLVTVYPAHSGHALLWDGKLID